MTHLTTNNIDTKELFNLGKAAHWDNYDMHIG